MTNMYECPCGPGCSRVVHDKSADHQLTGASEGIREWSLRNLYLQVPFPHSLLFAPVRQSTADHENLDRPVSTFRPWSPGRTCWAVAAMSIWSDASTTWRFGRWHHGYPRYWFSQPKTNMDKANRRFKEPPEILLEQAFLVSCPVRLRFFLCWFFGRSPAANQFGPVCPGQNLGHNGDLTPLQTLICRRFDSWKQINNKKTIEKRKRPLVMLYTIQRRRRPGCFCLGIRLAEPGIGHVATHGSCPNTTCWKVLVRYVVVRSEAGSWSSRGKEGILDPNSMGSIEGPHVLTSGCSATYRCPRPPLEKETGTRNEQEGDHSNVCSVVS